MNVINLFGKTFQILKSHRKGARNTALSVDEVLSYNDWLVFERKLAYNIKTHQIIQRESFLSTNLPLAAYDIPAKDAQLITSTFKSINDNVTIAFFDKII